jgi:hypothetical protein
MSGGIMRTLLVSIGLAIFGSLAVNHSIAQPILPMPNEDSSQMTLDSLRRAITKRILTDGDKKEIRACEREKSQFLKDCRLAETGTAELERKINEAKLNSADPNAPEIQALLEKKFALEKTCDDRFSATKRGKQCLSGEKKRQKALEKALKEDKDYQKWWGRTQKTSAI